MTNSYCIQKLLIGLLVLCGALNSCQRASYSFQQPVPVPELVVRAASAPTQEVALPVLATAETIRKRQRHPAVIRQSVGRSAKQSITVARGPQLQPVRLVMASPRQALPQSRVAVRQPTPVPPRKGIAVLLAVLFGIFGAHLFYLGYRKRGLGYLVATLLCVVLIALLLATLPAASLNTGLAVLFMVCMGIVGIAIVYAYALLDAVRIVLQGPDALG